MNRPLKIVLACVLVLLVCQVGSAQLPTGLDEYEIRSITFEGNDALSSSDLALLLSTRETPGFFSKFLFSTISEGLGRKNEYFNPVTLDDDIIRLGKYYADRGFRNARIDTSLTLFTEAKLLDIKLVINEGYRSMIDTMVYKIIGLLPYFVYDEMNSNQRIVPGDPYDRELLDEEVSRVLLAMNNLGFPNASFRKDSSSAALHFSTNNFIVTLAFETGVMHFFGDIAISQEPDSLRTDITDDIIESQMDYKKGDVYSLSKRISSERNLNRLGLFDLARIDETIPSIKDSSNIVPSHVSLRPKDKHELAPELLVSDENSTFNLGAGIGYTNRNFLGGARTFSTRLRFRTQTIGEFPRYFETNSNAVADVDLTFEMLQPYIFTNKIKGSWSFSLILDKQKAYRQDIIRNKFGFTDRFAEFTNGFLDWTLERVRLRKNATYPDSSSDPAIQAQIKLLKSQEQSVQFNSIISFTIQRDKTNDIFSPSRGFVHTATFTESGALPLLLKKAQPDLPFTQFYKISLLGRWYFDVSQQKRSNIFGLKLKGGFEDKYGESRSNVLRGIPQDHRFYAGGGGSVRGWNSRDLSASGDPTFGGNFAFEGSFELRTNLFHGMRESFLEKFWTVVFLDYGNVWEKFRDLQAKDVAIATGFGLRYDTFFGPFRIDYGFRVYNPSGDAAGKQWITERRFFGETFSEGVIHFGIGHSF